MRISFTMTIVAIAMVASPIAFGQAPANNGQVGTPETSGKPSEPASGGGDRASPSLPNLAGGGYADVPPGTRSKEHTPHRAIHARRRNTTHPFVGYSTYNAWKTHPFVGYTAYKAFPDGYCCCYCGY
jgi:hypothetical protein